MDKILKYKSILKELMQERIAYPTENYPHYKDLIIADDSQNHFVHIFTGWEKGDYFYDVLIHLALDDDKVFVYENNTDVPIEEWLVSAGILMEDIVSQKEEVFAITSL